MNDQLLLMLIVIFLVIMISLQYTLNRILNTLNIIKDQVKRNEKE